MRELTTARTFDEIAREIPDPLLTYAQSPPIATAWVPEVHFHVLVHAAFDRMRLETGSSNAFMRWVEAQNRALFSAPLYRAIFFVISPERLFRAADKRWSALRKGTRLEIVHLGERNAEIRIVHPAKLYTALIAEVRATSFRVAAELAGAKHATVNIEPSTEGETRFRATWS